MRVVWELLLGFPSVSDHHQRVAIAISILRTSHTSAVGSVMGPIGGGGKEWTLCGGIILKGRPRASRVMVFEEDRKDDDEEEEEEAGDGDAAKEATGNTYEGPGAVGVRGGVLIETLEVKAAELALAWGR